MSNTTTIRRVETLATDAFKTPYKLKQTEVMSLAESTDCSDVAELCMSVRFFDAECFREDVLGFIR